MATAGDSPMAKMLAAECSKCAHVAAAYVSPHAPAFIVIAVVGTRERSVRSAIEKEPIFPDPIASAAVAQVVKRVRERHECIGWSMSQRTFAGDWPCVYERPGAMVHLPGGPNDGG